MELRNALLVITVVLAIVILITIGITASIVEGPRRRVEEEQAKTLKKISDALNATDSVDALGKIATLQSRLDAQSSERQSLKDQITNLAEREKEQRRLLTQKDEAVDSLKDDILRLTKENAARKTVQAEWIQNLDRVLTFVNQQQLEGALQEVSNWGESLTPEKKGLKSLIQSFKNFVDENNKLTLIARGNLANSLRNIADEEYTIWRLKYEAVRKSNQDSAKNEVVENFSRTILTSLQQRVQAISTDYWQLTELKQLTSQLIGWSERCHRMIESLRGNGNSPGYLLDSVHGQINQIWRDLVEFTYTFEPPSKGPEISGFKEIRQETFYTESGLRNRVRIYSCNRIAELLATAYPIEFEFALIQHGSKKTFLILRAEVTQELYTLLGGNLLSNETRRAARLPVTHLSCIDATTWCGRNKFTLPTTDFWEFACKGGQADGYYCFGSEENQLGSYAWFLQNSATDHSVGVGEVHPVAALLPNGYGLFDVHGNVREMCCDTYEGGGRIMNPSKGGSAFSKADECRTLNASLNDNSVATQELGFRPVYLISDSKDK